MATVKLIEDFLEHVAARWRETASDKVKLRMLILDPKVLSGFALTITIVLFTLAYRYVRPILPVRVQCWFCGKVNKLPEANRNHFDCQYCEQYNGFSALGDYNKDIPAQREPAMNVFSTGAAPSGKTLAMYHNGLCELCNHRQTMKMQLRNQFEARDHRREEAEFEEYCENLEKVYPLCTTCKNHVRTRLASQNAKLLPHIMAVEAASWSGQIRRLFNSEFIEFIIWLSTLISFGSGLSEGWPRVMPLIIALLIMLIKGVQNRALVWCVMLRGVSIATTMPPSGSSWMSPMNEEDIAATQNALNGISIVCGLVGVFSPLQSLFARISGRKRSLFSSKFSTLPNLTKALAPWLSPAHRAFVRTYRMATRAPYDLEPQINSLNLDSARTRTSPEFGVHSKFGLFEQSQRPCSDILSGSFATARRSMSAYTPSAGSFQFGKPSRSSWGIRSNISRPSNVLRPSKLGEALGKQDSTPNRQSPPFYGGFYGNLTPPPSQDSSLSTSEEFASASQFANSFHKMSYSQAAHQADVYNGLSGLNRMKSDRKEWDTRTQHTVYSTVVHEYSGSTAKALWAIAVLMAILLAKLCWSDLLSISHSVYDVLSVGDISREVCPVQASP